MFNKAKEEAGKSLAELKGTEKQVAWAVSIRAKTIRKLVAEMAHLEKLAETKPGDLNLVELPGVEEEFSQALYAARSLTSAAWWIDKQYKLSDVELAYAMLVKIYAGWQKQ